VIIAINSLFISVHPSIQGNSDTCCIQTQGSSLWHLGSRIVG